ncbi:MAG: anaerobic ribonucleoside-triphosphate reductase activating protein [Oscillospiraceae bacterium]|nr:anaerobic ribonucleoside-triphosphate reductase activating protein [Oscillospiraceae bacterium]
MKIRIAGTVEDSIVDGPGLRFVVFVQGCPHRCDGCHNPETHDFSGGRLTDTDALYEQCMENPLCSGVTFSGGEPFCQAEALFELGSRFKAEGKHLMCYSGWTFEELLKKAQQEEFTGKLLGILDVLVDGRFDISKRSLSLKFRGSTNQRLINVPESLKRGAVVEYDSL